jgi:hypothetical protein
VIGGAGERRGWLPAGVGDIARKRVHPTGAPRTDWVARHVMNEA